MDTKDLEEKLSTVKTNPDVDSHLVPDVLACRKCFNKACLCVCPAGVYEWNEKEQHLVVKYENCLECGACRIACTTQSIFWKYPRSNFGITYKHR